MPADRLRDDATSRFQMKSTISAPSVAVMKPAPWSALYQPTAWPMKVARKAPAMPSTVVRITPSGHSVRAKEIAR